jgi:CO dehydrogenase maturation factor
VGLFHCPIGAAYYDDDACIDCGLCNANTSDEKVEASRKIREYIRSHTARDVRVGKIAVCGKGGAGKSTVTALLARSFVEEGYRVIVLDSDDSNPCLGRMLGVDNVPAALGELFSDQAQQGNSQAAALTGENGLYIEDIPPAYIKAGDGISFMLTGKIFDPFQGCSCSLAESARRIVERLRIREKEVLILDTEAGVESFGRGVERNVDTVLAVVEPSYGSIELAGRISSMAQGMGISRVGAILNKTDSEDMVVRITRQLTEKGINVLGAVNYSRSLMEASFEGNPLLLQSDKVAHDALRKIVAYLTTTPISTCVQ